MTLMRLVVKFAWACLMILLLVTFARGGVDFVYRGF